MTPLETSPFPAAVLWDMDGTLVDTEQYWMVAESELVAEFGGRWTHDDGLMLVGQGLWHSAAILRSHGVDLALDEIVTRLTNRVRQQLEDTGVPWRPGARELLADIRANGVPTALVTMSVCSMAQQVVDSIPFDAFDVIVAGDDVTEPKPHPEAYLRAAEQLGVPIDRCVAIEDSLAGVTSAASSGAVTIGVPHMIPLPQSPDHALWSSLEGRTLADLSDHAATRAAAL